MAKFVSRGSPFLPDAGEWPTSESAIAQRATLLNRTQAPSGSGYALEFDPTNNVMPHSNHVTIAHGRDYWDAAPVTGVALGGGEQLIDVNVEVLPPAA